MIYTRKSLYTFVIKMTTESIYQVVGIRLSKDTLFEYIKKHHKYIYSQLVEEYKKDTPIIYRVDVDVLEGQDIPGCTFNNFVYSISKSLFSNSAVKIFNLSYRIDDSEDFIIGSVVSSIVLDNKTHNIKASISDIVNTSKEMEVYFQNIELKESVNLYTVTHHS